MRTTRFLMAAGLIGGFSVLSASGQVAPDPAGPRGREPAWHTDFEQALAEAKRLNRPLLVHFYSEWCTPCRRMDRDVLRQPDVQIRLGRRFVVAKIDADLHPALVERFEVRGLPSDILITPDGQVLDAAEGFRERPAFLAALDRAIVRFDLAAGGRTLVQTQPVSIEYADDPQAASGPQTLPAGIATGSAGAGAPAAVAAGRPQPALIGLDGYSPVSLWNAREWRKGRPEFAAEHQDVTYYLANAGELAEFRAAPERYAPQLLGCDPVILFETDRALPGSTRFGAYYEGQLYLFAGHDTRARFKQKPTRYTQTQHVLRVDELDGTVLK
ncbi:MAG TPA: thioredoxin family protein [Planctomycetaceae bacterium]|nr:thioredoxin family protein [Planctomycetaceae bacterium]